MFARQIAVMKGQAWNVVETLKTTDHGPLELTRRARAYVWDDIIEIPIAVPLRTSSAETRQRRDDDVAIQQQPFMRTEEEMDISAANASAAPTSQHDLLGLGPSSTDFPNPKRFVLPRPNRLSNHRSNDEGGASHSLSSSLSSPAIVNGIGSAHTAYAEPPSLSSRLEGAEPSLPASAEWRSATSRSNLKGGRRVSLQTHKERSTHHIRHHARRRGSSGIRPAIDSLLDDEDLEGDLGYAAAEGMEKNQRRVIVERLENVKSKNPVFTWC